MKIGASSVLATRRISFRLLSDPINRRRHTKFSKPGIAPACASEIIAKEAGAGSDAFLVCRNLSKNNLSTLMPTLVSAFGVEPKRIGGTETFARELSVQLG